VATVIETSWTCPTACSITVTDPGGPVSIPFVAGQHFASTQVLLAYLKAQIEATLASTWTLSTAAGVVTVSMDNYPFSWAWGTATDLKDYLGYAADAAAVGAPWVAGSAVDGYLSLAVPAREWLPEYCGDVERWTMSAVMADGTSEAASVGTGDHRTTNLVLDLDNTGGTFAEHVLFEAWLDIVDDGRQFTVWPDTTDTTLYFWGCIDPGQSRVEIRQTYNKQIDYWRTSIGMMIQGVNGE
jgi:hypothetical protein